MIEIQGPSHPGEVLREYMPAGLSVTDAAKHLGITRAAMSRVLNSKAGISAEMDLSLSDALGTSPGFWMAMQVQYDIWQARQKRNSTINKFPQLGS
jgi:addiction module HigA family antidote